MRGNQMIKAFQVKKFIGFSMLLGTVWTASTALAQQIDLNKAWNPAPASVSNPSAAAPACGEELLSRSQPGVHVVSAEAGAEPGATDRMGVPAGRYQLLPDSGILAYIPKNDSVQATYYTTDKVPRPDLNTAKVLRTAPINPNGYGPTPVFATAGR